MPRRIPDYPDAFYTFNKIASWGSEISAFSLVIFLIILIEAFVGKRGNLPFVFLQRYFYTGFPIIIKESLLTGQLVKLFAAPAIVQISLFSKFHFVKIPLLIILVSVLYMVFLITVYNSRPQTFLEIEQGVSTFGSTYTKNCWSVLKKRYISPVTDGTKNFPVNSSGTRHYSSSATKLAPESLMPILHSTWQSLKVLSGSKMVILGNKFGSTQFAAMGSKLSAGGLKKMGVASFQKSQFLSEGVVKVGKDGFSASGNFTLVCIGGSFFVVAIGADQAASYLVENSINTITQENHVWDKFQMKDPGERWGPGK